MSRYQRILLPTDFSPASQAAISHAEGLARRYEAELLLVHIVTAPVYPGVYGLGPSLVGEVERSARESAESQLAELVDGLKAKGLSAEGLLESGAAARRLVELVSERDVDLVVMATHGHTGLSHALLGSTAEKVVRTCPCPVLTVKASAE